MARSNRRSRRRSRNQRGGFLGMTNPFAGMFKKEEEKPVPLAPTESTGGDHYPGHPSPVHMGGRRRKRRRTKRRRSRKRRKSRKKRRKSRKSRRRRRR